MFRAPVIAIVLGALIILSIYVSASVWRECRDAGHSIAYCTKLISR